jgi:chaperonin GroES
MSEKKQIQPVGDRLVIRQSTAAQMSAGGIYIPDNAKEKPAEGEVIAAGLGRMSSDGTLMPMTVRTGDVVLFNRYAGQTVKVDNDEYIIVSESEVFGILRK